MFRKSLWFAIVMSLFMVGANFVDAKGASSSGGFSGGGRSSFSSSSSGFSSGSKSSFSSGGSSGFSSGSKATTPTTSVTSGFTGGSKPPAGVVSSVLSGGNKSETTTSSAPAPSGKTDMMSNSVKQERSNSVYSAADKSTTAPGTPTANAGSLPPSVVGGNTTVVKETTVIRDRSSGPSWFPVPIFLGGGGGGSTTVINNSQPTSGTPGYVEVQGTDTRFHDTRSKETRSWAIFFYIIGVAAFILVAYIVIRKIRNQ